MEGRVNRYLNIRTGEPRVLPNNNPGFLRPNDTIDVIGIVIGDVYRGNNVWYKLKDGSYVWSGGVDRLNDDLHSAVSTKPGRVIQFDFPTLVKFNAGLSLTSNRARAVVAIMDTGGSN